MSESGKKVRKRLRISGLLFLLLIIFLIGGIVYYLFTVPVKTISVLNNNLLTEKEIIEASKINVGSSLFKTSFVSVSNNVKSLPLIDEVKVSKNIFGRVTIKVKESKILFINNSSDELVLASGKTIDTINSSYIGYPTLVNYVPSEVLENFTTAFTKIDDDVIHMISEIVYDPDVYNDTVLDEERFLLRMNDGNLVYINNVNIEKLNRYQTIFASVGSGGILYLDSSSNNYIFNKFGEDVPESGDVNE